MNTFPPIREERSVSFAASRGLGRPSLPFLAGSVPTIPGDDDAAVIASRATAGRIRGGTFAADTAAAMQSRVRLQFLRRCPDTESSMQPPLVFPPLVPSRLRPERPQAAPFLRGIQLLKELKGSAASTELDEPLTMLPQVLAGPAEATTRASTAMESAVSPRAAAEPDAVDGSDGKRNSIAYTAAPSNSGSAFSISRDSANRTLPAMKTPASGPFIAPASDAGEPAVMLALRMGLGADDDLAASTAASPALVSWSPSALVQLTQLRELEEKSRQHLCAIEAWDRQVACEIMMVHYVTFVLKPETEELLSTERAARGAVQLAEETTRLELCQNSPLAAVLRSGVRATRAKQLKLARLRRLEPETTRGGAAETGSHSSEDADPSDPAEGDAEANSMDDARAILQRYVELQHGEALHESVGGARPANARRSPGTGNADNGAPAGKGSGPAETFHKAAAGVRARRRSRLTSVVSSNAPSPVFAKKAGAHADATPAARRCSGLVLPPIFGALRMLPRRNTLGVADYVLLLDEDAEQRRLIERAEEEQRDALVDLARGDWNSVRGWQLKQLHLQRLLYWRGLREEQEQRELKDMTDTEAAAAATAAVLRAARERDALADAESEQRLAIQAEESTCRNATLAPEGSQLALRVDATKLLSLHAKAGADSLADMLRLLTTVHGVTEVADRQYVETVRARWMDEVARPRAAVLRLLQRVSRRPPALRALRVLQDAFRSCLRHHLGWRCTHRQLGEDIRRMRAAKLLARGRGELQTFRSDLELQQAALGAEELARHTAAQRALQETEYRYRVAVASQEELMHGALRRQFVEDLLDGVLKPKVTRCVAEEHASRLDMVVREGMRREEATRWFTAVARVIDAKERTVEDESGTRSDIVGEEALCFHRLSRAAADGVEGIRAELKSRENDHGFQRTAFITAAEARLAQLAAEYADEQRCTALTELQRLLVKDAMDSHGRLAIERAEGEARGALRVELLLETESLQRALDEAERQRNSVSARQAVLLNAEATERHELSATEQSAWVQLADVDFYDTPNGEQVRTLRQQRRAVAVIGAFYVAVRDGALGRSATTQHYHDAFAFRRELGQLKAIRAQQKQHVRGVQDKLQETLEEERAAAADAVQVLIDVLVQRTEPRARRELADMEGTLRGILVRNCEPLDDATSERESVPTTPTLSTEDRIDRDVLRRQELRERAYIIDAWSDAFTLRFLPEKAFVLTDTSARVLQRWWRQKVAHRHQQIAMKAERDSLFASEASARAAVEQCELQELALEAVLPALYSEASLRSFAAARAALVSASLVAQAGRAPIVAEELAERAELLWAMRCSLVDDVTAVQEASARQRLLRTVHAPGIERAGLEASEALVRSLLSRERTLFLLRILAKEEAASRSGVMQDWEAGLRQDAALYGFDSPL